jgi:peptidoglycan-associated lipoprotein
MKTKLIVLVTGLCLFAAACKKNVAVAPAKPDPTPVQEPAPAKAKPLEQAKAAPPPPAPKETPAAKPAEAKKLTPQQRVALNELLAKLEPALFDYDKATIRPDAAAVLRDDVAVIRSILADYPAEKLRIEGHADERGTSEYNLALGDRRATAAKEFLASMGIPAAQLTILSFGEERPVCTTEGEDCWQKNRRAHITVAP